MYTGTSAPFGPDWDYMERMERERRKDVSAKMSGHQGSSTKERNLAVSFAHVAYDVADSR